jgi:hypothetical protein
MKLMISIKKLVLSGAAVMVIVMMSFAAPAMAEDYFPYHFDTSNWKPTYTPAWCYDSAYKAAVSQYATWDQINYDCDPGPLVR